MSQSNHEQAVIESQMSKPEAEAYATRHRKSFGRFRRRWRVEGTPAGNSRLVTLEVAWKLQARTGGEVVEVVMAGKGGRRSRWLALAGCPVCYANGGNPCVTRDRRTARRPHRARR